MCLRRPRGMGRIRAAVVLLVAVASIPAGSGSSLPRAPETTLSRTLTHFDPKNNSRARAAQSWYEQSGEGGGVQDRPVFTPSTSEILFRAAYLCTVFLPLIVTSIIALGSSLFRRIAWYPMVNWTLARGGAAWIKWAQWASTRPDMFPQALCAQLAKLQSDAPSHSYSHTRREVALSFGAPIELVFSAFNRQPIASGSIAQVHQAVWKNQTVAVKVRHPRVAERITTDFQIMQAVATWLDRNPLFKWLNLASSIEAFSHTMTGQTWLDIEANHLAIFNHNFRGWKDCGFPQPLVSTESVLIESFESGQLVSDFTGADIFSDPTPPAPPPPPRAKSRRPHRAGGASASDHPLAAPDASFITSALPRPDLPMELAHFIVTRGEDLYLKMLIGDGLMHADLHPGNILINYSPTRGIVDAKIVLVDAGMVAKLRPEEQRNFVGLLEAIGEGDGREAAQHLLLFSSSQTCVSAAQQAAFTKDMDDYFRLNCHGYGTNVDLGSVLRGVLDLVRRHGVRVDVNYATLVMNALCLDGMAKVLLPGYNVLDGGKALLRAHRRWKNAPGGSLAIKLALPFAQRSKRLHDARMSQFLERLSKARQRAEAIAAEVTTRAAHQEPRRRGHSG